MNPDIIPDGLGIGPLDQEPEREKVIFQVRAECHLPIAPTAERIRDQECRHQLADQALAYLIAAVYGLSVARK